MDALLAMPGAPFSVRYIYAYMNMHKLYTAMDMDALLAITRAAFSIRYVYMYE